MSEAPNLHAWPRTRWVPNLTAFVANGAIMVMEMAAGPLISRYVGGSLYTWTAIIGVVMAGMAIGNALGGRLADRMAPARALSLLFILAGLGCIALLPLNNIFGALLAPAGLSWPLRIALHTGGVFIGPAILLGAITPVVARLALQVHEDAGRTVGTIFAWSVGGSIVGTFLTGYYLVYAIGVRELNIASGATLALLGLYFAVAALRHKGITTQQRREESAAIDAAGPGPARATWMAAYATVFTSNALFMMMELSAARVISRQFGPSIYSWTAVIGVMLAGITLGNYIGGRLADRDASRRRIASVFLWASFIAFLAPVLSLGYIVAHITQMWLGLLPWPVQITLHVVVAFFLPCVVIGTVSPIVVKRLLDLGARPGRSIGGIYALGSAGGIVGTFATGYYLIDWIGSLPVLGMVTALLALVGALYARSLRSMLWLGATTAIFIMALLPYNATRLASMWLGLHNPAPPETVYQDESQYSYIAIVRGQHSERMRHMFLDKLMHSTMDLDNPLDLKYEYEWLYEGAINVLHPGIEPVNVLALGGGGFVFPHFLELTRPGSYIETAEIDPAVTEAAHAEFGLPRDTSIRIYDMDARNRVDDLIRARANGEPVPQFDVVLGDSFAGFTVPRHLTTLEFARHIDSLLAPDGVYLMNLIDYLDSGLLIGAVVRTLQEVFPQVELYNTGRPTTHRDTFVVVCSKTPRDWSALIPTIREKYAYKGWKIDLEEFLTPKRATILTDNYAPVDLFLRPLVDTRRGDRGENLFILANEAVNAGELDEALEHLAAAERYGYDWPVVHELRAVIYDKQGKRMETVQSLQRALEGNPEQAKILTELGTAQIKAGLREEAAASLQQAVELEPGYVPARSTLGKLALSDGKYELALEQWRALNTITPKSAPIQYNIALSLAGLKKLPEAVEHWREAISIDPKHYDSYHNLALALHMLKRDQEARETLDALRAAGGTPDAALEAELKAAEGKAQAQAEAAAPDSPAQEAAAPEPAE
jgi:tetratricopeptide (TPR) repeat protein/predicted membrane-bound spermidine synthase